MLGHLMKDFEKLKNPAKAKILEGFFKTGKGEYGEGDIFLGIVVPLQRQVAKKYTLLPLSDLQKLLNSRIHEYRLSALFILIAKYDKASQSEKETLTKFYLKNSKKINNWDLVDLSSPNILGRHLFSKERSVLYTLASSSSLWERRIAILATLHFIRNGQFNDTLSLAEKLLGDKHDLIHKAVGWMLREIGKRDQRAEEGFLMKHYRNMPRTMLRYAIERFSEDKKNFYLSKRPQ